MQDMQDVQDTQDMETLDAVDDASPKHTSLGRQLRKAFNDPEINTMTVDAIANCRIEWDKFRYRQWGAGMGNC